MSYISLSQAFAQWKELAVDLPKDDFPMLAESWNNYTDSLCKDGGLCDLQRHYAPAYDDEMPGEGTRWDALSDDREFILEKMGVTLTAQFVPHSHSRNKSEKEPSLNWRVTLKLRDREVLTADYTQGCGHCPAYKNPLKFPDGKRDEYRTREAIARECETGKRVRAFSAGAAGFFDGAKIDAPPLVEVFGCFLSDARVLECGGFEGWASEYGYDTDSIKARSIYDACLEHAMKMNAAFGGKTMADLHELFEGM